MTRPRIYVAGPMRGEYDDHQEGYIACGIMAGRELIKAGFQPFIPHLSHYVDSDNILGVETWLEMDLVWISLCHAVLRLSGDSKGADAEVAFAQENNIPVYYDIDKLKLSPPMQGDTRFHQLLARAGRRHDNKQQDYGRDDDPFANIRASEDFGIPPWLGAVIRANDKMRRIQTYARRGRLTNEAVDNDFMDCAVYMLIGQLLYEEQLQQTKGRIYWDTH